MKRATTISTTPIAIDPAASQRVSPVQSAMRDEYERDHQPDFRRDVLTEHDHELGVARVLRASRQNGRPRLTLRISLRQPTRLSVSSTIARPSTVSATHAWFSGSGSCSLCQPS